MNNRFSILLLFQFFTFIYSCKTKTQEDKESTEQFITYPDNDIYIVELYIKKKCSVYLDHNLLKISNLCNEIYERRPRYCINEERSPRYEIEIIAEEDIEMGCINRIKYELRECDLLKVKYFVKRNVLE